jgi:hypothetical protein
MLAVSVGSSICLPDSGRRMPFGLPVVPDE